MKRPQKHDISPLGHHLLPCAVITAVCLFLAVPVVPSEYEAVLFHEYGVLESLTAIFYLWAFAICVTCLVTDKTRNFAAAVLWCALCFMFFGEETSWLQHYLQYQTPEALLEKNLQNEFNLHNLEAFTHGSWHRAVANKQFDLTLLLGTQNLFRLGFLSYFVLLPLLFKLPISQKLDRFRPIVPDMRLSITILAVMACSFVAYSLAPESRNNITEIREFFYAFFIAFYVFFYLRETAVALPKAANTISA